MNKVEINQGEIKVVFNEVNAGKLSFAELGIKSENASFEEIDEKLKNGYRVDHPGVANFGVDRRLIPTAAAESMIDASALHQQVENLEKERDRLLDALEKERVTNDSLQQQIAELNYKLGRAESLLEYLQSKDDK